MDFLKEYDYHFGNANISRILYYCREEGDTIPQLKTFFASKPDVDARFSKKIPYDIVPLIIPNETILIFDDFENTFSKDKQYANMLFNLASIYVHHKGLIVFFLLQTTAIMKAEHKLHTTYTQSTHVVFFRDPWISKGTINKMNNFQIRMKGGLSIHDVYQKFVQNKAHAYLILFISPKCDKHMAFTNILLNALGPMLSHHESSDEE